MQEFNLWAKLKFRGKFLFFLIGILIGSFFLLSTAYFSWERKYRSQVYPGVKIAGENFGGKRVQEVEKFFQEKNSQISLNFTFTYKNETATFSAQEINWGYNTKLMATQAFSFGRSGNFFSDFYHKALALKNGFDLNPSYSYNEQKITAFLEKWAEKINFPPQEALFHFAGGRVVAFRPSQNGQALNIEETKKMLDSSFTLLEEEMLSSSLVIELSAKIVEPKVTTEEANNLGIKELVGQGSSRFLGSIPNRVHNIQLAADRLNGILVAPGEEFSFNQALGDVSKFTGYKEAYIIKEGRTVLGDGGGVCQVSTTFFRALLNAGLPILERHPHSYRVAYYEQDSPVGLDASVYAPQWDLRFKNDTGGYLLIQSSVHLATATLTFEFYGTSDGRRVTLSKPIVTNQVPPPEDLYQDDLNLPKGQIKQVDWKAWGADVSFSRTVTRKGQTLISETFKSHYQPWQAVFLRGTKE